MGILICVCVCLNMQVVSHHVAPSENGGKPRGWTSGTVAYLTNPSEIIWLCQNSYWSHGPVEIVDLPSWKMVVIFHSYVNVYHRVSFRNPEWVVEPYPSEKYEYIGQLWSVGMMKFHSQLFLESHSKFHGSKPPTRSYLLGCLIAIFVPKHLSAKRYRPRCWRYPWWPRSK